MWFPFPLLPLLFSRRIVHSSVTGNLLDCAVLITEDVHFKYNVVSFEGGFGCYRVIECIHEFVRSVEDAPVIVVGQVDHENAI